MKLVDQLFVFDFKDHWCSPEPVANSKNTADHLTAKTITPSQEPLSAATSFEARYTHTAAGQSSQSHDDLIKSNDDIISHTGHIEVVAPTQQSQDN